MTNKKKKCIINVRVLIVRVLNNYNTFKLEVSESGGILMIRPEILDELKLKTGSCMYSLLHMMRAYGMFTREAIRKYIDLNVQRVGMLILLRSEGNGISQAQLADELCVKPSSVTSMLNNMEKEDLIVRKNDAADKRIKRIYFTEKGEKISEEAFKYITGVSYDFFCDFTDDEKKQFIFLLNKVEKNILNIME